MVEHQQKDIVKVMDDVMVVDMTDIEKQLSMMKVYFIGIYMKDMVMLHMKAVVQVMEYMMEGVKECMMEVDVWIMDMIMKGGYKKHFLSFL